jgi:hypothetical protein
MHLNTIVGKGVRASNDETLQNFMQTEGEKIFENDHLSFVEPESIGNEYKTNLRQK